jgi:hypothetical protein
MRGPHRVMHGRWVDRKAALRDLWTAKKERLGEDIPLIVCEDVKKPPLDPDVADTAPTDSVLTLYDEEHIITYLRMLDADAAGARTGRKSRRSCYISIPSENRAARAAHSTATSPAPNG